MENPIIVPFDLNTAREIKNKNIKGSVLMNCTEIEFIYESKNREKPYCLLFVTGEDVANPISADIEGNVSGGGTLTLRVEAGAYFKKGSVLTSISGNPFIYDGCITHSRTGSICGITAFGSIEFNHFESWTDVYGKDKNQYIRKATEREKEFLVKKIIEATDSRKINIIKQYLSEYEYLLNEIPEYHFKPFEQVLVRRNNQERWKLHLFSRDSGGDDRYECLGGVTFSQCIPYKGNKHLLGTNENK